MNNYEREERIAIRMDSHMSESEAIRLTDAEQKAKVKPEAVARLEALQQKAKFDRAEKQAKKANRFSYD